MKLFRFIRDNSLVAVAAVLLTACGTQAKESADAPSTPPAADATAPPSMEATGQPEKPQQPGGGGPSIPVPTLPIGRDGGGGDPQVHQCVKVKWLGDSDVPKNVSVLVKSIQFTTAGVFDKGGSGCDGIPGCAGFAFTSTRTKCSVPVTAKESQGKSTELSFTGELRCPAGQDRLCRDFAGQVSGQTIELTQPDGPLSPDEQPPSSGESPPS